MQLSETVNVEGLMTILGSRILAFRKYYRFRD